MKCPNCGRSYGIRTRIKTNDRVCGSCGYIGKKDDFDKDAKKEGGR
jgi:transcription initiation factor TFIIIB Brf1 subunit/transcription initiation factor TFIIB